MNEQEIQKTAENLTKIQNAINQNTVAGESHTEIIVKLLEKIESLEARVENLEERIETVQHLVHL